MNISGNSQVAIMAGEAEDRISAAVWRWRDRDTDRVADRAAKRKRRVLIQSMVILVLSSAMLLMHWYRMSGICATVGAAIVATGFFAPVVYDAMDRFVAVMAQAFGVCLTWLLLVPFFFLCFLPGRLLLLARGRDPMCRKFPTDDKTYWVSRPERRPDHFQRQY